MGGRAGRAGGRGKQAGRQACAYLEVLDLHVSLIARLWLVGGPQSKVVAQQLHDKRGVLVALLAERVELCDGVVEGLLSQVARAVWRVQDLVIEYGEVQRQAEADGVRGGQVGVGDGGGRGVRLEGLGRALLAHIATLKLSEIPETDSNKE